jgi:hypothetical protein
MNPNVETPDYLLTDEMKQDIRRKRNRREFDELIRWLYGSKPEKTQMAPCYHKLLKWPGYGTVEHEAHKAGEAKAGFCVPPGVFRYRIWRVDGQPVVLTAEIDDLTPRRRQRLREWGHQRCLDLRITRSPFSDLSMVYLLVFTAKRGYGFRTPV